MAVKHPDSDSRVPDTTSLAQDVLALAGGESREKVPEITVAMVVPVKLAVMADHEPLVLAEIDLGRLREQQVETARSDLPGEGSSRLQQQWNHLLPITLPAQQALSSTGRVGNR